MKKIFLPILFLFVFLEQALCFDMQAYIKQHSNQNWQVFLESFPYHEYLKTVDFANFQTIQRDRYFVWKFLSEAGGSKEADGFLYYLADNYLRQYPISVSQLDARISIGEAYLNPEKSFDNPRRKLAST